MNDLGDKMKLNKAATLLLASSILVGCENPMKTMKTMKDTTGDMSVTTKGMGKTTNELKGISSEMKDNMLIMHDQVRIKEARDTRDKEFKSLIDPKNEVAAKLAHAGVFFKSMEYQLWTGNESFDNAEKRDKLILDAVKEFIRLSSEIHGKIDVAKLSPVKKFKKKNNMEFAFYALATAMHENNHYQEILHEDMDAEFELLSFYDIVKKAILKEELGGELKEYELEILSIRNILNDLVQARFDMLTALGVKSLGDKAGMKFGAKLSGLTFKLSGGKLGKIKMKSLFSEASYAVKKDILKKLDGAVKVLEFAKEAKINLTLDETLSSLINNLEMAADANAEDELLKELNVLLDQLIKVEAR